MDKKGTCWIFGAGEHGEVYGRPGAGDFVIAADGGLLACRRLGVEPDLVAGDFDSLGSEPRDLPVVRVPVAKDETDMLLCVRLAIERGYRELYLYGGSGGRLDHTIANLQTLFYAERLGASAYLFDTDFVYTTLTDGELTISGPEGGIFSVFCHGAAAEGVCERGSLYTLDNARLDSAFPLGVSNHFLKTPASISVRRGQLLIGWQHGGLLFLERKSKQKEL